MNTTELNKIVGEMMVLYKQGKIDELVKIRDAEDKFAKRQMAANMILQIPRDTRRLY